MSKIHRPEGVLVARNIELIPILTPQRGPEYIRLRGSGLSIQNQESLQQSETFHVAWARSCASDIACYHIDCYRAFDEKERHRIDLFA